MAYNASERKDVRKAEKAAIFADRQRQEVIKSLMQTIPGRAWVLDLLEACHIFSTSFHLHTGQMAFAEGQRDIGLRLLNDIMQSCPDQYILMMRERNEKDAARSAVERTRGEDANGRDQGSEPADDDSDIYRDAIDNAFRDQAQ